MAALLGDDVTFLIKQFSTVKFKPDPTNKRDELLPVNVRY
jgi:hypothetical protein